MAASFVRPVSNLTETSTLLQLIRLRIFGPLITQQKQRVKRMSLLNILYEAAKDLARMRLLEEASGYYENRGLRNHGHGFTPLKRHNSDLGAGFNDYKQLQLAQVNPNLPLTEIIKFSLVIHLYCMLTANPLLSYTSLCRCNAINR